MYKIRLILTIIMINLILSILGCSEPEVQADFGNLVQIDTDNKYLICPKYYCNITPDEISPVLPINIKDVAKHLRQVMKKQPRTKLIAEDNDNYQYTYIQKTKTLRFPDTVNIILISLENNHTTLAIYSRSKYGYSDLGVNKQRVEKILSDLAKSLNKHHNI